VADRLTARRSHARLALVLAIAVSASLTFATPGTAADETSVQIVYRSFRPASLTVAAGTTVTWHNTALVPHTATALDGAFDSGRIDGGASFSYTFTTPGTFEYMCTIHPTMKGTVVVLAPGASPPSAESPVVRLSVSRRRETRGSVTLVRVQADAPAATVLLQSKASPSSPWKTARRARLSATGTVTFALGASVHGRLRALISPTGGGAQLRSSAVAARA
jgi:plastocyanin